jgi:hypothetical protein
MYDELQPLPFAIVNEPSAKASLVDDGGPRVNINKVRLEHVAQDGVIWQRWVAREQVCTMVIMIEATPFGWRSTVS